MRASCLEMQKHAAGIATFPPIENFVANDKDQDGRQRT